MGPAAAWLPTCALRDRANGWGRDFSQSISREYHVDLDQSKTWVRSGSPWANYRSRYYGLARRLPLPPVPTPEAERITTPNRISCIPIRTGHIAGPPSLFTRPSITITT